MLQTYFSFVINDISVLPRRMAASVTNAAIPEMSAALVRPESSMHARYPSHANASIRKLTRKLYRKGNPVGAFIPCQNRLIPFR